MKKIYYFILTLLICLFVIQKESSAKEIINLLSVNNIVITNYDFEKYNEMIKITQKRNYNKQFLINYIINEKIKEIELEKMKIKIDENQIEKLTKNFVNNLGEDFDKLENDKKNEVEHFVKNSIRLNEKWNEFVNIKFSRNFKINIDEVNKIAVDNNLNKEQKEKLKVIEINKKLISFSNSLFEEIKRDYYIKLF